MNRRCTLITSDTKPISRTGTNSHIISFTVAYRSRVYSDIHVNACVQAMEYTRDGVCYCAPPPRYDVCTLLASSSSAAADLEDRPSRVRGSVRQQPEDPLGDFVGRPSSSQRDRWTQTFEPIRRTVRSVDLRFNQAGGNRVHADALRSNFPRQSNREAVDCAFARRVVNPFPGTACARRQGRYIDNRPSVTAVACRHPFHRFTGTEDCPGHICSQHLCEVSGSKRLYARKAPCYTGIVHESVDRPHCLLGDLKEPNDVRLYADVTTDRDSGPSGRPNLFHQFLGSLFIALIIYGNSVTSAAGKPRNGGADPAAAAGDD